MLPPIFTAGIAKAVDRSSKRVFQPAFTGFDLVLRGGGINIFQKQMVEGMRADFKPRANLKQLGTGHDGKAFAVFDRYEKSPVQSVLVQQFRRFHIGWMAIIDRAGKYRAHGNLRCKVSCVSSALDQFSLKHFKEAIPASPIVNRFARRARRMLNAAP
ncbi:MAG: hypothetical protein V4632_15710 [Pseudomonadota bacterium]